MGRRLQEIGLGLLNLLLRARKVGPNERPTFLRNADVDLDRLRYTVRLCQAFGLLSPKQYQHGGRAAGRGGLTTRNVD